MTYPPMPPELAWVLSVSIDGLRPWEYWQMDSEEYSMIVELRGEFRQAVSDARAQLNKG